MGNEDGKMENSKEKGRSSVCCVGNATYGTDGGSGGFAQPGTAARADLQSGRIEY